MEINFVQYLIVCPLVFLAGFVDSIAGGGGLISLPAYMIAGLPAHMAIGTNKVSSSMGGILATIRYGKAGYIKNIPQVLLWVLFAYGGSTLGAKTALLIDDRYFKIIMLIVVPLTAAYVIFRKDALEEKEPLGKIATIIAGSIISFAIGFYDGFYGPGTGTFLILLFVNVVHLKLNEANGAAKTINMVTGIAALVVYLLNGAILLPLGLAAGVFSLLGTYFGTKCFTLKGAKIVKPIMLVVLLIFFVKIIVELVQG